MKGDLVTTSPKILKTSAVITVIGSLNVDLVTYTSRVPDAGETLTSESFSNGWGGKGANQAVAAVRLTRPAISRIPASVSAIKVAMIGAVGADTFGPLIKIAMQGQGVDTTHVSIVKGQTTGVAVIIVESSSGQNRILVNPGANALVTPEFLTGKLDFETTRPSLIVMQLETPLETVLHVCREAKKNFVPVLLNPAPAIPLPDSVYADIILIVANETEASQLSGIPVGTTDEEILQRAYEAADYFAARGCRNTIVTLGALGAVVQCVTGRGVLVNPKQTHRTHVPAQKGNVVDTTAAGDTFIGAIAVALAKGWVGRDARETPEVAFALLVYAVKNAVKASSWTIARKGTWDAMPRPENLN